MFYKIIIDNSSSGKLFMPHSFFVLNRIYNTGPYIVNAGLKSKTVDIFVENNVYDNTLVMSKDVVDFFSIPVDINYQIQFHDNQLFIGPILGLLITKKFQSIGEEKLLDYAKYASHYLDFQGILCLFAEDSIDFENNLIEGYYIRHDANDNQLVWKKSILPFPKSIYRRSPISNTSRRKIIDYTENKVFNSHYLNKWSFWKMTKKVRNIRRHLPKTKRFRSIDDIDMMIERYDSVYLKPQNGTLCKGIVKISMLNGCYFAQTNEDKETVKISNKEELNGYLRATLSNKKYIIQQSIDILKLENRCTSFRVIMQKDQHFKWHLNGIIMFLGKKEGICSSHQTSWCEDSFNNLLSNLFSISPEKAQLKKQELVDLCLRVCDLLDMKNENFADVGIDIGIDNLLNLWIFEVNCRNNQYPPLAINDNEKYDTIRSYPIKYGVSQSGF